MAEDRNGFMDAEYGGQVFSMVHLFVFVTPLLWLLVWGFQELNFRAFAAAGIFIIFVLMAIAAGLMSLMSESRATYGGTAFSMWIGMLLAAMVGMMSGQRVVGSLFSAFTIDRAEIFSTFEAQLPTFWRWYTTNIGAPYSEEALFLLFIPVMLLGILTYASRDIGVLKSDLAKVAVMIMITAPLFAYFHVGNIGLVSFAIAAIIFRSLLIASVWGDRLGDWIPSFTATFFFAVGYHIMNNVISTGGIWYGITVLATHPFGVIVGMILLFDLLVAVAYAIGRM